METTVQVPSDNIMPQPGPVNIVKIGSDGKLVLDEEGLRKIVCSDDVKDLDVAVVSIAGTYRSGKSFLMNLLASYLQRYQEGEVPVPCYIINAAIDNDVFTLVMDRVSW